MLSFKKFTLAEAGDHPYDFDIDQDKSYPGSVSYKFKAGGADYGAHITHYHQGKHAEVVFGKSYVDSQNRPETTFHIAGDQGTRSSRILSTIHNIVKKHVADHPSVQTIGFTSDTGEPSRVALYKRYTHRLGGETHDSSHIYDTMVHTIPATSYRDK